MKIVLTGGGTGGSIAPLLAIYELLKDDQKNSFLFIGGKSYLEKDFADEYSISFQPIASGKLRRYFDLRNFLSPFFIIIGFFQALRILFKFKPNLIMAAGSFVAVPVVYAGFFLKIPCLVHQQDIKKGLANTLISKVAKRITVSLPVSLKDFPREKTILTGNPVRTKVVVGNENEAYRFFNLKRDLPAVLILGGGTGALAVNQVVSKALPQLVSFCQIIHVAGKGKNIFQDKNLNEVHRPSSFEKIVKEEESFNLEEKSLENYHVYEFLSEELKHAYQVAKIVVTRAGMSTLTELAFLGKPIIIIPLPKTHQELNAKYFEDNGAALTINQEILTPEIFVNLIHELLQNKSKQEELKNNLKKMIVPNATNNIINEINKIIKR